MIIRLEQLGDEPFEWQESLQLTPSELNESELDALDRADCHGQVRRTADGFFLSMTSAFEQTLTCARCLSPFKTTAPGKIDLLILVGQQEPSVDELELSSEDLGLLYVSDSVLDTRPLLLEQMHLGIPFRPLCREDCAGLCQTCGENLNQKASCGCNPVVDPRWAALQDLKNRA